MMTLVEYFVHHYALVLNNDQGPYNYIRDEIKRITRGSDVTLSQYLAMSEEDRATEFAMPIGEKILETIGEWYAEAIEGREDTPGGLLIREIMIESDSDVAWQLGKQYLPEDSEAEEFFIEGDDESDA